MRFFVPITKIDVEKRQVWGRATQEVADRAKEIFDYDSSKPLFESWSSNIAEATKAAGQEVSLGNVRAMHGKVAAGKLSSIDFNDTEKAIDVCSDVVDDNEWEKCLRGVYTGFSIGGKYVKKWKDSANAALTRYTADPSEISLVDLPCVPTATFAMVKSAGVTEEHAFERCAVLKEALDNPDLTVGELLKLAQEYLPDDETTALAKANSGTTDYLARLTALVAEGTELAKSEAAPAEEPPATPATESAPTGAEGDEAAVLVVDDKATLKAAITDKLAKGMWTLSSLAELLMTIAYMAQDADWEAKYEEDNSSVPADLRAWLAMGVELFKKMTAEETAELIASVTPPESAVTIIELAAGDDLGKKGARNSKKDQKAIQAVHDHATSLGASCEGMDKSAPTPLAKAVADLDSLGAALTLAKGAAPDDGALVDDDTVVTLAKFAVSKAEEVVVLTKRVTTLEAMPVQPKGVIRAMTKADDDATVVKATEIKPDLKDPAAVMKAVHAGGGVTIRP